MTKMATDFQAGCDLMLSVRESAQELETSLEYRADLFESSTIAKMLGHFQMILEGIVTSPRRRVRDLPLLTEPERRRIVVDWNQTQRDYPKYRGIHELFERQVERTPDSVAVEFQDQRLSYRELNRRANRLGHYLRNRGVGPDALVGICVERSLELVVGVLGILKAGGACVPLDPAFPPDRLAFMLQDSNSSLLLTQGDLLERLSRQGPTVVCLDRDWEIIAQERPDNPSSPVALDHLVYVIYTSGSTGRPKGVALPHRALANLLEWQGRQSSLPDKARTLQYASLSFDVSFQELFATWGFGGTLVLAPASVRRDFAELAHFVAARNIHRLFLPFVALQHFAEAAAMEPSLSFSLKEIITAGEQLQVTPAIIHMFHRFEKCSLVNQYGPTESHVVTAYTLAGAPEDWPQLPPIGRPIENAECYVLDARQQPVPVGVPGELYVGGIGLARGYWNRPELTEEKFITHPFRDTPGARLYCTGDLVRWLPDGNLEFLGRLDHQVKIRGFRVELGEIEAVLRHDPQVTEAVVVAREDIPGEKQLVAYVVPRRPQPELKVSELRVYLHEKLPDYMVPAAFVMLKALPLTPSGKIDRKGLPAPNSGRPELDHAYAGPRTQLEEDLARLWAAVLNIQTVGIHDNFFDLGGHSLLAVRLFARIEDAFDKKLPLATLFEHPTIAGIARILQQPNRRPKRRVLVKIHGEGSRRPLFFSPSFGGESFFLKPLARHLGDDQPIWGFQIPEEDGIRKPFRDIETMAAFFVDELTRSQIDGPYCLAGYSFGGAVALETARQLWARGHRIALLAIFDWGLSAARPRTIARLLRSAWASLRNLPYWLVDDFLHTPGKQRLARLASEMREAGRRLRNPWGNTSQSSVRAGDADDALAHEYRALQHAHVRALEEYKPRPYPGRVTLFRSRCQGLLTSLREHDFGLGRIAAGGVDVKTVPGNHLNMIQEPFVKVLARELRRTLDDAQ